MERLGQGSNWGMFRVFALGAATAIMVSGCSGPVSTAEYPFAFQEKEDCVLVLVDTKAIDSDSKEGHEAVWLKFAPDGDGRTLCWRDVEVDPISVPGLFPVTLFSSKYLSVPEIKALGTGVHYGGSGTGENGSSGSSGMKIGFEAAYQQWHDKGQWIGLAVWWADQKGAGGKGYLLFKWDTDGKPIVRSPGAGVILSQQDTANRH